MILWLARPRRRVEADPLGLVEANTRLVLASLLILGVKRGRQLPPRATSTVAY